MHHPMTHCVSVTPHVNWAAYIYLLRSNKGCKVVIVRRRMVLINVFLFLTHVEVCPGLKTILFESLVITWKWKDLILYWNVLNLLDGCLHVVNGGVLKTHQTQRAPSRSADIEIQLRWNSH